MDLDPSITAEDLTEPLGLSSTGWPVTWQHTYKPGGKQAAGAKFIALDDCTWTAPRDGIVTTRLYLRTEGLIDGAAGMTEVRLIRHPYGSQPMDPTAYDSRVMIPAHKGVLLFSAVYLGPVVKGRRYTWQARVAGIKGSFTTRYSDWVMDR